MAKAKTKPRRTPPVKVPEAPQPLRLEWRTPSELAENPKNWRTHPPEQIDALTGVISEVGWAGACLFNETTGRLIDGHARKKVAVEQGAERVPVLVGSWTEEQEAKILASLDPIGAMAGADATKLDALLSSISTDNAGLSSLLESLAHDNPIPEVLPEPGAGGDEFDTTPADGPTRCQPGDVWLIGGKHRLLVGDCTDKAEVERMMNGVKVGLCFTSPPYAQQRDYGEKAKEKVQDWYALMCGAFAAIPMTDAGQVLVNLGLVHRDGEWVPYWDGWIEWMRAQGWRRFGWYVWDQGPGMMGDWSGRFAPSHEFIWHFNRESVKPVKARECKYAGASHRGGGQRDEGGTVKPRSEGHDVIQSHAIHDSVFRVNRQGAKAGAEGHPAPYPIGLPTLAIQSWPGDVFDPFLGSGTTLIAAHRLGRVCYGCEIEPKYADVILRRAEAEGLTVEKAG